MIKFELYHFFNNRNHHSMHIKKKLQIINQFISIIKYRIFKLKIKLY
jgi:hypothetical protein